MSRAYHSGLLLGYVDIFDGVIEENRSNNKNCSMVLSNMHTVASCKYDIKALRLYTRVPIDSDI